MIDPLREKLISLLEAAGLFPPRRRGRKPHVSCIYRYTTIGYRGIILESVQAGGTRATSREAVARFLKAITEVSVRGAARPAQNSSAGDGRNDDVDRQLDAAGL